MSGEYGVWISTCCSLGSSPTLATAPIEAKYPCHGTALYGRYSRDVTDVSSAGDDLSAVTAQARGAAAEHDLTLAVIVPVFNNGEHLRTTSFPSLAASAHFSRMHVLLIDDGSSYRHTRDAVAELAHAHPNVTAFFRPTGGSGSASVARNIGLELAFTEHVGYLDPDDELLPGHWSLVDALSRHDDAQLAIGNQVRVRGNDDVDVDNIQHYCHRPTGDGLYHAGGEVLSQAKFRSTNLSSWVARTAWLKSTGLQQVEGAAGQDSLFFLQVFAAADRFAAVKEQTYRYTMDVPGSMVNTITAGYFRKALIRESAQTQWLQEAGLFDAYLEQRFEHFLVTWYLSKFDSVPWPQREEAAALITEIAALYIGDPSKHRWRYPQAMQFFGRWSIPSVDGLRPWAGQVKHGAQKTAQGASERAAKTLGSLRSHARTLRGRGR